MLREPVVPAAQAGTSFGRYEIVHELATGGMGTVYLGRMRAARGVSLTVAIKRINRALADDPHVLGMFVDEARITALIRHPNVVQTLDVVEEGGELLLVMEYVHGVSLARLLGAARARGERLPIAVACRIASDVLAGLHAAHETTNELGKSLEIVHRDVSPQNIIVGVDGVCRVADFGIARAANRMETTRVGEIKGKLRYIAPEQFEREAVDRRADVYGVGLLLWEMITGSAMRRASSPGGLTSAILASRVDPPSRMVPEVSPALDEIVVRALANDPRDRFAFAAQMGAALEEAMSPAPYVKVAEVVRDLAHDEITERKAMLERAAASLGSIPTATPSSTSAVVQRASPLPVIEEVAAPPVVANPSTRRNGVIVGTAAALAVIAALFTVLRGPPAPKPASAPAEPAVTSADSAGSSAPAEPSTSATSAAPSEPTPGAIRSTHWRKRPHPPQRPGASKPDCTIPYVVDRNGIRVPRPECM